MRRFKFYIVLEWMEQDPWVISCPNFLIDHFIKDS